LILEARLSESASQRTVNAGGRINTGLSLAIASLRLLTWQKEHSIDFKEVLQMAHIFGNSTPLAPIPLLIGPEDLSEGASSSPWISLANYRGAFVLINIGDRAGAASAVSFDQATDNSGTGSKTLSFTKYFINGQRLSIGTVSGSFSVGETITGGSSSLTATVIKIRNDELVIGPLTGGTTWTNGETITGGTSSANAVVSGTGTDEDIWVEKTAASDTFSTAAVTFKQYMVPITDDMLDVDNGFDHFQLDMGDAAASESQGCAVAFLFEPRISSVPAVSSIGAQKFS
jgi:hypothetical protein